VLGYLLEVIKNLLIVVPDLVPTAQALGIEKPWSTSRRAP
jgi:TRAP-type mannitol/chloroaromatic compound transport system permease large subunit